MKGMWRAVVCLLFAAALVGQGPQPLNPAGLSDDQADIRDDALIRSVLDSHISVDDIYASKATQDFVQRQADEMVSASQRRIIRAERRVEDARSKLPGGVDPNNTLAPLFTEVETRIKTGYEVLERANILRDVVRSARLEARRRGGKGPAMDKFDGNRRFSPADMAIVATAYETRFRKKLPISADGQTSLHSALGFDHRGRVDVALSPDQTEGLWLCNYLRTLRIPYYAFRKAIPGSATSAHIHIGPGSARMHSSIATPVKAARRNRGAARSGAD
jgi:hypothetical protein